MTEAYLRQAIPVFINSFNQPSYLISTLKWFYRNGFRNVTVMDNASASPDLHALFRSRFFSARARLLQLGENMGPRKALIHLQNTIGPNAPFIFTDPDLDLPYPPHAQLLTRMFELGQKYDCVKVGLALDISQPKDFRDIRLKRFNRSVPVQQWEKRFWRDKVEPGVYRAPVDTTFFLHVPASGAAMPLIRYRERQPRAPALRLAGPGFIAKHRPWYKDDGQTDAERAFYHEQASGVATWIQDSVDQDAADMKKPGSNIEPGQLA